MSLTVREASHDEVRDLRLGVLRPTAERVPAAYDLDPATIHIGAFDGETVVGCASVFPSPYDDEPLAWQLRGMAVDPSRQGEGIGRLVLDAAVAVVASTGAPLMWANGRVSALGFYAGAGWEPVGDVFEYGPASLPHYVIVLRLHPRRP